MFPPSVSEVGDTYSGIQARLVAEALSILDQALRRGRSSPVAWRDAVRAIGNRLLTLQVLTASLADPFLNDVLDAQGADGTSVAQVNAQAFADVADGGGSWLRSLVYAPNSVRGSGPAAWSRFQFVAGSIVKTGLGDTARAAVQAGMQARPAVAWYVRMLRGTSCARCAILAGRRYRSSVAFRRHKRCDCVNIPAAEGVDDWSTNPKTYFRDLDSDEQDRIFTKAGAAAIRLGADIAQVVNARAGIEVAQAFGRDVQATTVGTTIRGVAGQRLSAEGSTVRNGLRTATTLRLLPDEIFLQAERLGWDKPEILRQLQRFGYLL